MEGNIRRNWKDVKLTAPARSAIREAIRKHPNAAQFVKTSSEVSNLRKTQLLNLAADLGLDLDSLLGTSTYDHVLDRERGYPFKGTVEFDIKFGLFGKEVTRRACLHFEHSPEWAYYDRATQAELIGRGAWTTELQIEAVHARDYYETVTVRGRTVSRKRKITWETCSDLTAWGIFSEEMSDEIDAMIDEECRTQDLENRKRAGMPLSA